jgi:hypothetical protein
MIRFLAILAVLFLVGKAVYHLFEPSAVVAVASSSPEEQLRTIATTRLATAEQLASLCDSFPQLARKYLGNGTPIRLTGNIQGFRIAGLDGRRANLTLDQSAQRPLIAVYDLDHYATLGLEPLWDHRVHYLIVGNELLKVTPAGIYHRGTHRIDIEEEIRSTVFTQEQPYTDTVTLTAINPGGILVAGTAK